MQLPSGRLRLEGKVAIVTGAGSVGTGVGNGKAAAITYAREGARVMLVDYNLEAAEETNRLVEEEGGDCIPFQADVSKSDGCRVIVEECIRAYGTVDILHNNGNKNRQRRQSLLTIYYMVDHRIIRPA